MNHRTGKQADASHWTRLKALMGTLQRSDDVVFLSDGGHVENTGLYPLLRRRCALMLAVDGEEDPKMTFSGLLELQHLARVELGVQMDIDTSLLELGPDGRSQAHFTVIPVQYPRLGGDSVIEEEQGLIVYAKLSLTGDEPR